MSKLIQAAFKNKALIAYLTYGDPSIKFTQTVVEKTGYILDEPLPLVFLY